MENISTSGRRRRLAEGVILAIGALASAVYLIRKEAMAASFVLVFVLVLLAALMFLQARDKT